MRPAPDLVPIEELDRDILSLCTRINAATYELLVLVREFDERAGFLKWGLHTSAEWLAWRCDLSMTTALEKVRVARALKTLPEISAAFSTGELSYSKVRSLTRVADGKNEAELVAFALRHTTAHVAERCRELRNGDVQSIRDAERAYANRSLRVRRDHQRGMMTITVELPMDTGELLEKALDKARDDEVLQVPDLADTSWSVRQADAFVNVVSGYLSGGETCLDNLLLLCTKHHTLVHEGGFRIEKDYRDDWAFVRPDGVGVPKAGYHAQDFSDVVNNPPRGGLLSVAERVVSKAVIDPMSRSDAPSTPQRTVPCPPV